MKHRTTTQTFFSTLAFTLMISLIIPLLARANPLEYPPDGMWSKQQAFLPERMHLNDTTMPLEAVWQWQGHRIHIDRFINDKASAKVILMHGVGTNGRQMSMILGGPLWKRGYETIALDMPGYGMTKVGSERPVAYSDWVQIVSDFVDIEHQRDPRPIILFGLSAGGMQAYHVAAQNSHVSGVAGMTFLDQRNPTVRDKTARNLFMSRMGVPTARLLSHIPLLRSIKLPMRMTSKMYTIVNNDEALPLFLKDKTSSGNWMSLRFLAGYMDYTPKTEPQDFTQCPVLLTQPAQDRWTPISLSRPFLDKLTHVDVAIIMLENAGHYPLEMPGLKQLEDGVATFIETIVLKNLRGGTH